MVEILKQPQFKPMNVIDQVMVIFAGTKGFLDKVPIKRSPRGRINSCGSCASRRKTCWDQLAKSKSVKGMEATLKPAIEGFQSQFKA